MDSGEKELVNFSLGWGFFQTEDESEEKDGWSVSHTQESMKRHREEEELANKRRKPENIEPGGVPVQGECVGLDEGVCPVKDGQVRGDDHLGGCDLCEEPSSHFLGYEDSNILKIRDKVNVSQLCDSHHDKLVRKYTFFQKSCCDPHQLHKKQVKADLIVVTMDMYMNNPILLPGKKVCSRCATRCRRVHEEEHPDDQSDEQLGLGGDGGGDADDGGDVIEDQSQQSSIHEWSQEYQVSTGFEKVNRALSILNISPLKKSQLTNAKGMERKLDNIRDGIKEQLNLGEVDQNASDASELLESLKSQYDRAVNRCEKYKILTSLPDNWTEHKIAKAFGCSRNLARDALRLRSIYGQGSDPGLKAGHKIPNEVSTKVLEFYYAQDVTKQLPGKKDCILVREGGTKTFKQKRLLLASNLGEAYAHFKSENPDITIAFSTFASMRPKEVILPGIPFQT